MISNVIIIAWMFGDIICTRSETRMELLLPNQGGEEKLSFECYHELTWCYYIHFFFLLTTIRHMKNLKRFHIKTAFSGLILITPVSLNRDFVLWLHLSFICKAFIITNIKNRDLYKNHWFGLPVWTPNTKISKNDDVAAYFTHDHYHFVL